MKPCQHLESYLSDLLAPGQRADFEAHIATCAPCRSAVEQAQHVNGQLLAALQPIDTPRVTEVHRRKLLSAVRARRSQGLKRRRFAAFGLTTGTAVVAAVLLAIFFLPRRASEDQAHVTVDILSSRLATLSLPNSDGQGTAKVGPKGELLFLLQGDRIGVAPGAELSFSARQGRTVLTLTRVTIAVDKPPGHHDRVLAIHAGNVTVTVTGTRLFVSMDAGGSVRTGVSRGTISVLGPGSHRVTVRAPAQTLLAGGILPAVVPLEDRWRRQIRILLALGGPSEVPPQTHTPPPKTTPDSPVDRSPTQMDTPPVTPATAGHESLSPVAPAHPVHGHTMAPHSGTSGKDAVRSMMMEKPPVHPAMAPEPDLSTVKQLILSGRFVQAEGRITAYLTLHPTSPLAWWLQGESLRRQGKYPRALKAYASCVRYGSGAMANRARFRQALVHQDHLGSPGVAARLLRSYLAQSSGAQPLEREASLRLVRALLATGDRSGARQLLKGMVVRYQGVYKKRAETLLKNLDGQR